jgi:cell division protein FtsQ
MSALASARRLAPAKLLRGLQGRLQGVAVLSFDGIHRIRAGLPFDATARGTLVPGPLLRRRLAIVALLAALLGATYILWLRDSGLVAVEEVQVTGPTGRDAGRLRAALDGAARGMTTLHVDHDALEAAVEPFPVVQAIEVEADFPNRLRVTVIEHRPVAVLVAGEKRIPVAGDGSVLAGLPIEGSLPEIPTGAPIPAAQLEPGATLDAALVAGGAPGALVSRLEQVEREEERGLVVAVKDGPELIFGNADRLTAKWAAAVRVLADPDAAGAEYLDLRLPERPAAGGLAVETVAPVAPAGEDTTETPPVVPETDPAVPVEPAQVVPEAVPGTEPAPGAPEALPEPVAPAPGQPLDPGGGAVAEPQP